MLNLNLKKIIRTITGYKDPTASHNGLMFEVNNWTISNFIIDKIIPIVGVHPYPLIELEILVSVVCYFKPDYIYEWGTHEGKSARIFWETINAFKLKTKITTIDLSENAQHVELPTISQYAKYIRNIEEINKIRGDGLDLSIKLSTKNNNNTTSLFFLDGDHEFNSVLRELETIFQKVKDPCVIVHDTFYQTRQSKYNTGPYDAIQKILGKRKDVKQIICNNLGLPGMSVLVKLKNKQ